MSKYHIETTKTTIIDGIKYSAEIDKYVDIDFSAAIYTVKTWEDVHDAEIELIPDNMDFLHEVTEIFPVDDFDIKIIQSIYRHAKAHISLYLDIRRKDTGAKVYFAEGALLSDRDYDYIRDILEKGAPQYKWQTAENYIRTDIEQYMGDRNDDSYLTDDAFHFLSRMVSARYKEIKTDGYIDFNCDGVRDIAREILESALRNSYEQLSVSEDEEND